MSWHVSNEGEAFPAPSPTHTRPILGLEGLCTYLNARAHRLQLLAIIRREPLITSIAVNTALQARDIQYHWLQLGLRKRNKNDTHDSYPIT